MKQSKQQLEVKLQLLETEIILAKGGQQKEVREKFGDTLGQKLWFISVLNKRFPEVSFVKRLTELDQTDPGYLKFSQITGAALPMLGMRSDPRLLDDENLKRKTKGLEPYVALTEEKFEVFLGDNPKVNVAKLMSRANIEALANEFPTEIVRDVARAIRDNNMDYLNKYAVKATLINDVVTAILK